MAPVVLFIILSICTVIWILIDHPTALMATSIILLAIFLFVKGIDLID